MAEGERVGRGVERAAILLMAVGEKAAAEIMKHLTPKEVQKLGLAMASINNVTTSQVETVVGEFVEAVSNQPSLGVGNEDYIRNVLMSALGEEKAGNLMDRIVSGATRKGLEALKWMDPRAVAEVIRLEHPQIISIVLDYLDGDHAEQNLALFPARLRAAGLMRIASLEGVHPSALKALDEILERQFSGNNFVLLSSVGGCLVVS